MAFGKALVSALFCGPLKTIPTITEWVGRAVESLRQARGTKGGRSNRQARKPYDSESKQGA